MDDEKRWALGRQTSTRINWAFKRSLPASDDTHTFWPMREPQGFGTIMCSTISTIARSASSAARLRLAPQPPRPVPVASGGGGAKKSGFWTDREKNTNKNHAKYCPPHNLCITPSSSNPWPTNMKLRCLKRQRYF